MRPTLFFEFPWQFAEIFYFVAHCSVLLTDFLTLTAQRIAMVGAQPEVFKMHVELGTWISTDFNPPFIK